MTEMCRRGVGGQYFNWSLNPSLDDIYYKTNCILSNLWQPFFSTTFIPQRIHTNGMKSIIVAHRNSKCFQVDGSDPSQACTNAMRDWLSILLRVWWKPVFRVRPEPFAARNCSCFRCNKSRFCRSWFSWLGLKYKCCVCYVITSHAFSG